MQASIIKTNIWNMYIFGVKTVHSRYIAVMLHDIEQDITDINMFIITSIWQSQVLALLSS